MADGSVQGLTQDRYEAARTQFEENLSKGEDIGASFCATVEGETVVDLWGGYADPAKTRAWERDTIVNVYSTTKTMTALTALLIADRGDLDFDAPVARYWPEFAANGKADIKVSHLMSHSAGLSGWKEPITTEDLYDWEKATSLLAAQAPFWEAGTAPGYHALTQGYLVGEVVRRITGKSLGTVFREEIAEPLGADFHIGLPASEDHRVAELLPPPPGGGAADMRNQTELMRNMSNNPGIDVSATKTRGWRGAEIPAAGGTGNARSVAEIHTILANGGVANGKRFMSEAGCRKALELQVEGRDLILDVPARFGLGFGLPGVLPLPNPNSMYWGGYGGSLIIIDMDARTTFAYVMNKMMPTTMGDMRALGLAMAMWTAMGTI
ncbi:serine hydrolase domain-containing protein [Phenylobacterium sp.]|uniref:serine hydrolase domain-containing protein n=1 Tax=Phenylobacterium sp. TaxID=1871053 RepID=UPI0025CE351A|nr:serine hydrolase domain-containing protein [Phenylobacterium sp.]